MTAPSNDVLKNMIDNLTERLEQHARNSEKQNDSILALITTMQKDLQISNGWKSKFMGALAIITMIVVPIMGWALYEIVNLDQRINDQLTETLETNFDVTPYGENNQ